jgi:hypothetical protein
MDATVPRFFDLSRALWTIPASKWDSGPNAATKLTLTIRDDGTNAIDVVKLL